MMWTLKKIRFETLLWYRQFKGQRHAYSMNQVLQAAGVKKQSFHQMMKRSHYVWEETEQLFYLVDQVRKDHPRMSVREIYFKLRPSALGRDKFEKICFSHGYQVLQKKELSKDN